MDWICTLHWGSVLVRLACLGSARCRRLLVSRVGRLEWETVCLSSVCFAWPLAVGLSAPFIFWEKKNLRCNLHIIKLTCFFKCPVWWALTNTCSHSTTTSVKTQNVLDPESSRVPMQVIPSPRHLALRNHWPDLFVFSFVFSRMSSKWNREAYSPFCMAAFTWHDAFRIHPCCYVCQ